MSPYTYTHVYTRAQALVDQVSVLFLMGGIDKSLTDKVCRAVQERWLETVGLYLERDGHRVYEIEASINWSAHSGVAELEFSTELPGWEDAGSPEAIVLGARFAAVADDQGLTPRYWVRFVPAIRADPDRHRRLCPEVGVVFKGKMPSWATTPTTRSLRLQDLRELGVSERSTL